MKYTVNVHMPGWYSVKKEVLELVLLRPKRSRFATITQIRVAGPDPDPLVRGTNPDPAPDPSIIKQK